VIPSRLRGAALLSLRRGLRFFVPLGAGLAAAVVLAGCGGGSKARPAEGGSGASGGRVWKPGMADTLGPVVAVIGDRRIRAYEVDSIIQTAPPSVRVQLRERDGYKNLVERLVTEEVIYQAARRAGLEKDPAYQAAAAKAVREALMRTYYQRASATFAQASDSAIQAYYEEHKANYNVPARVRVRHIQTASRARAEALRKRLAAGGLWDALAKSSSTDKATAENGGILGFVTPATEFVPGVGKAPGIVSAAFSLKEGETSRPLKSEKGWHLIRVDQHEPERTQPLSDVRQGIFGLLATQNQEAKSEKFLDSLRTASGATVFDDSIAVAVTPSKTPQDIFKEAQAAVSPQQRIGLYRDVVARFPDDPVSIQAQFMIGFTYAEDLGDYDAARTELQKFIAKNPNSELTSSAKWMLENMDKPAPELKDMPGDSGGTGAPPDSLR
jgi:peptidyl-prolyl cis-trans isomerase C